MQKQVDDNVKNNNRAGKTIYLHNTHTHTQTNAVQHIYQIAKLIL